GRTGGADARPRGIPRDGRAPREPLRRDGRIPRGRRRPTLLQRSGRGTRRTTESRASELRVARTVLRADTTLAQAWPRSRSGDRDRPWLRDLRRGRLRGAL